MMSDQDQNPDQDPTMTENEEASGLGRFIDGIESAAESEPEDAESERKDGAEITDRCRALTTSGDRCTNAKTYMTDDGFCSVHTHAADVEAVSDSKAGRSNE